MNEEIESSAEQFIRATGRCYVSALQRNFRIDYWAASDLMKAMEKRRVVTPMDSQGRRTVIEKAVTHDRPRLVRLRVLLQGGAVMNRIVCQFSCGAASAVATKLALAEYSSTHDVQIVNAYLANEHPDNRRFASDCEAWFGRPVTVLRDEKYGADAQEVFRRERYMKNQYGAPCTKLLKRRLLDTWKQPGDVMVFGFTAEEADRLADFRERNPDRPVIAPLIDRGLGKEDCKAMIERAGIELPLMYRMGYDNANCIGCVKGGEGYFRAIREDFPEQFEGLCLIQDDLGEGSYLFRNRTTNVRFSLRDLGDGPVRRNEKIPACSFFCEMAEADIADNA